MANDASPVRSEEGEAQRRSSGGKAHRRGPLVGLVRNPLSHRGTDRSVEYSNTPHLLDRSPATHKELRKTLEEFRASEIDYIAVKGGDGTLRDVLTWGDGIFGEQWPPFILVPKGKTNALAVDIGLPKDWSLKQGLDAVQRGNHIVRRPLRLSAQGKSQESTIQGYFLGAGAFKRGTHDGQAVHRLSLFNSLAVAVIVLWSIMQIVLGGPGNRWRQRTRMRLRFHPQGNDLPHSNPAAADQRFLLVATTYERLPLGARPFGKAQKPGLKLGIIDSPRRWLLLLLPLIAFGLNWQGLPRFGAHRLRAEAIEMKIEDSFIVDGETFPSGHYIVSEGPALRFVVP